MEGNHDETAVTIDKISKALEHPSWRVRRIAVHHLLHHSGTLATMLLNKALTDSHKAVRVAALEACADLAPYHPVAPILAALSDPEWSVRAAAAWALGHFSQRAPLARLLAIFHDHDEDVMVRASALHALGSLGSHVPISHIITALDDPEWHIREVAALSLGKLPANVAIKPLVKAAGDSDPFVRAAAAGSLGQMGEYAPSEVLLNLLNDEDANVCQTAAWVLGELSEVGTRQYLALHTRVGNDIGGPPGHDSEEGKYTDNEDGHDNMTIRHHKDIEFVALEPSQLHTPPAILQTLDNQWLPRSLLQPVIAGKLSYTQISKYLNSLVRTTYIQALLNYRQLVVNRAYLYNNPVIANDYTPQSPNREVFKEMLRTGVLIPVLFNEQAPDTVPTYGVSQASFADWQQICREIRMYCIRCSWDDERNQELVEQQLTRRFHTFVLTAYTGSRENYTRDLGLEPDMSDHFLNRLYQVTQACLERHKQESKQGEKHLISRETVYKQFVTAGTNPAERRYSREDETVQENTERHEKPFAAEIKQLIDLAYNSYLADALHGYLLTPIDSLPHAALQKPLDAPHTAQVIATWDILAMIDPNILQVAHRKISLQSLGILQLRDIMALRKTSAWATYITTLEYVRQHPEELAQQINNVYQLFIKLNSTLVNLIQEHERESRIIVECTLVPELVVNVARANISIQWREDSPVYMYSEEQQPDIAYNQIASIMAQFNIKMQNKKNDRTKSLISIEILSGITYTAQELWKKLIQYVQHNPDFKEVTHFEQSIHQIEEK